MRSLWYAHKSVFLASVFLCLLGLQISRLYAQTILPTVVSINVCTDRLVMALAKPEQIRSLSFLAQDPGSVINVADISIPTNRGQFEEIFALDADIIVASAFDNPKLISRLRQLGHRVVLFETPGNLDEVKENITQMGHLLDQVSKAAELLSMFDQVLVPQSDKHQQVLVVGASGYVNGSETLIGQVTALAGYDNTADRFGFSQYGQLQLEQVVASKPDVVFMNTYSSDYSTAQQFLYHPAIARAFSDVEVIKIPSNWLLCGDTGLLHYYEKISQ